MLVVGIDVHKKSHTVVAVDQAGVKVAEVTVPATDAGHLQLLGWARQRFGQAPDRWAVEDCRHLTGRLERALLGAGDAVARVPPKRMAGARRSVRTLGKSDPIDALAVARAAVSEQDLPVARLDEPTRELKLLIERRDQLVAERTREVNRIRWHLHAIDPVQDPAKSAPAHRRTLHRIAITQVRLDGLGKAHYDHRRANGDSSTEAYRALKRRLARLVFNTLNRPRTTRCDLPSTGRLT